jgi:SAM-dependent methyltransferase
VEGHVSRASPDLAARRLDEAGRNGELASGRPAYAMLPTFFPEVGAGGFTRIDGTVEFFSRVNALLRPEMHVVDFGAGRGAAFHDDPCEYRRALRLLRGKVAKVIGVDVDPIVKSNPGLDEAHVVDSDADLPLRSGSIDLIIADFTFEHIRHAGRCAAELRRILKPGGWLCARTPNRWGYVALAARLLPDGLHQHVLRRVQPNRKVEDTFEAHYRMNDLRMLRRLFPATIFEDHSYTFSPEPAYLPESRFVWAVFLAFERFCPSFMRSNVFLFMRKRLAGET